MSSDFSISDIFSLLGENVWLVLILVAFFGFKYVGGLTQEDTRDIPEYKPKNWRKNTVEESSLRDAQNLAAARKMVEDLKRQKYNAIEPDIADEEPLASERDALPYNTYAPKNALEPRAPTQGAEAFPEAQSEVDAYANPYETAQNEPSFNTLSKPEPVVAQSIEQAQSPSSSGNLEHSFNTHTATLEDFIALENAKLGVENFDAHYQIAGQANDKSAAALQNDANESAPSQHNTCESPAQTASSTSINGIFADKSLLKNAIICAEILGQPVALRDNIDTYQWR